MEINITSVNDLNTYTRGGNAMIEIHSAVDSQLTNVPTCYKSIVKKAVLNLCSIRGPEDSPEGHGFVVFIEPQDQPDQISALIGKDLSLALEGAFRDGGCLVGVIIYGNSGSGVTLVCPETTNYASAIGDIFRSHLSGGDL
jgi:hypothetical protein